MFLRSRSVIFVLIFISFFISFLISGCVTSSVNPSLNSNINDLKTNDAQKSQVPKDADIVHVDKDKNDKLTQPNDKVLEVGADALDVDVQQTIVIKESQLKVDSALEFCQMAQEFWQKGDLDEAIQNLDQAYSLIVNVDTAEEPKLTQQKDDIRFMISKRILEIYASRNIVVNGTHKAIPVTLNKHVLAEIKRFTGREKKFFQQSLKRSGRYRPMIVRELKKAGLPEELSWLPLIESGYKVRALSKARALGLWQFIPSTGYKFGMKRDVYIDERLDPVKSTFAAISYLTELHGIFGDWATVLAAYNCGEGRVLRTIRKQNVNYLDNFWDLYGRLPRETARYVPRFLAVLHIIGNPEKYKIDLNDVDAPLEYETVMVSKQVYLKDIAKKIDIPAKKLKYLNPELRYKILPTGEYPLKVPLGKSQQLLVNIDKIAISKTTPEAKSFFYHRVRRGESLSVIARKYKTTMRKIASVNNIRRYRSIAAGKLLKIPQGQKVFNLSKKSIKHTKSVKRHVVKRGDSLWNLARRYGTTTKKIKRLNNMRTANLSIGQVLKINSTEKKSKRQKKVGVYKVRRGDSLFIIAKKYKMKLNRLFTLNRLNSRSTIYPGQKLYVE